jgi:hypothetical protein
VAGQSEQVKNRQFERGSRWFHLFFIDFQLFYFLSKVIPDINALHKVHLDCQIFPSKLLKNVTCVSVSNTNVIV